MKYKHSHQTDLPDHQRHNMKSGESEDSKHYYHDSMHLPMSHKDHLAAEHERHSHRIDHEKTMHDMHGRKYH